jgi:hypothetical protein
VCELGWVGLGGYVAGRLGSWMEVVVLLGGRRRIRLRVQWYDRRGYFVSGINESGMMMVFLPWVKKEDSRGLNQKEVKELLKRGEGVD